LRENGESARAIKLDWAADGADAHLWGGSGSIADSALGGVHSLAVRHCSTDAVVNSPGFQIGLKL
jgi:hypothetical protein